MIRGRCRGCGELVEADHGADGQWGHTVTVPVHVCGGDPDVCYSRCPDAEAGSCGPIEVEPQVIDLMEALRNSLAERED